MESQALEVNKKIARRFFELFSKTNVSQIETLWSPGYQFHFPGKTDILSKEETIDLIKLYHAAFPDMVFTIEDQVAEENFVVTRFRLNGTHKGEYNGIASTHKKISVNGITTHRIENEKITEEWWEFDLFGIKKQIGAVPENISAEII